MADEEHRVYRTEDDFTLTVEERALFLRFRLDAFLGRNRHLVRQAPTRREGRFAESSRRDLRASLSGQRTGQVEALARGAIPVAEQPPDLMVEKF